MNVIPVKLPAKMSADSRPVIVIALMTDPDDSMVTMDFNMLAIVVDANGRIRHCRADDVRVDMGAYMDIFTVA